METRMSIAEYQGLLRKYRLNNSDVSSLILMKTGAIISPQAIRSMTERGQVFSATMTAVLRLLFRMLDDVHEKTSV